MSSGIQIIETTEIPIPPLLHQLPPSIKISFLDSFWIMIPPVQKLIFFPKPDTDLAFPSLLEALKSSLVSTLLDHLSLAGKLVHVPETGDIEIDISEPSVGFVEAVSELDFDRLARSEIHDVSSFMKLVPTVDVTLMPFPVLAVQVTRFNCGGVAIGYSVHHSVVDGKALHEFVEAWASSCRAKLNGVEGKLCSGKSLDKPLYDRSVIQYPRGDEIARNYYKFWVPDLPKTKNPPPATIEEGRLKFTRRTFELSARSIQSLKQRAMQMENVGNNPPRPPSTFSVVSAYIWACYVRTRSMDPILDTLFFILVDLRARLNPPLPDDYFGNCLRPVRVRMLVGDLLQEDGLARACTAMSRRVSEVSEDPLGGCENWFANLTEIPVDRAFNVSASPRFRVYETDFGWGKPVRFEPVSMNRDGEFSLVGGKEEGSVQVSVGVKPEEMEEFEKNFLGGLED